ncbi:head-tail joining protein [Ruixingdingia sedimenti]|uniref:Uncharacterized protein n=1 Tax=Ruixingdingia sedimenti TaxID=3073604 RepID=A0ABU1FDB2_9RHOB|nr:hypothetical protein [Xinfangfangia sp. LG-4]MDR5654875.1 hypothetical protein [Xinfangfangia sp. LG-4]
MDEIGAEILDEFGEDAVYTTTSGTTSTVRAVLRDRGARARIGRGIVLTSDATAAVSDALSWQRNATLTVGGSTYRIDAIQVGAPGLTELGLVKLSGPKVETAGISDDVISEFGRPISFNGQTIQAHIVRTGVERKMNDRGVIVETVHTVATVRIADAPDVKPRDQVTIGGRVYSIRSCDRDGFGLVALTLD